MYLINGLEYKNDSTIIIHTIIPDKQKYENIRSPSYYYNNIIITNKYLNTSKYEGITTYQIK